MNKKQKWRLRALIPLPSECESDALPYELNPVERHLQKNNNKYNKNTKGLPVACGFNQCNEHNYKKIACNDHKYIKIAWHFEHYQMSHEVANQLH